jgi:hypothetical protein
LLSNVKLSSPAPNGEYTICPEVEPLGWYTMFRSKVNDEHLPWSQEG